MYTLESISNPSSCSALIFTENEYFESTIDPNNGADWNKSIPAEKKPTLDDFKSTVGNYLAWEISNLLKKKGGDLGK